LEYELGLKIWLLVFLVGLSAFFSSSETALFSMGRVALDKLKKSKPDIFHYINELLSRPRRTLITILLGNEVVNTSFSVLMASLMFTVFEGSVPDAVLPFIPAAFSWPILVMLGEILPKSVSVRIPERMAVLNAPVLYYISKFLFPVKLALKMFVDMAAKPFLGERGKDETIIDEDFFRVFVDMGTEEGILDKDEKKLIEKVFFLDDIFVSQVMTDISHVASVPEDINYSKLLDFIRRERYSRIPVYVGKDRTVINGILNVKDLVGYKFTIDSDFGALIKSKVKKPIYLNSKTKIIDALKDFQLRKIHMAVVVDDQSKVLGLVTLEDILEELFGEIKDEYDIEEGLYEKLPDGTYKFDLRLTMGRFSEVLNYTSQRGDFSNLTDFLTSVLGRKPKAGDSFITEGFFIRVTEETGRLFAYAKVTETRKD
jgi:putative hemolysin